MIYDLSINKGIEYCRKRLNALAKKGARADLKQAKDVSSDPQRKYFHKILRMVADDRGIVFDKFKDAIIIHLGYYEEILNEKIRSKTSEMGKKVYSKLIDDYYHWANSEGYMIMTSEEYLINQFEEE